MLTFDPEPHIYRWNGRRIPSVTQVLEPLFDWSSVPAKVLERKRQIGVAVHSAIHMELTGGVDMASIDPSCVPYFDAWRRFRDDCHFEPVLIEFRVVSAELGERYRFAGTLDEWGPLQGDPALIDWKTCMQLHTDAVGAQTAAYLKSLVRMGFGSLQDRRFALKLGADGRYKLEPYIRIDHDWQRFLGLLREWNPEQREAA